MSSNQAAKQIGYSSLSSCQAEFFKNVRSEKEKSPMVTNPLQSSSIIDNNKGGETERRGRNERTEECNKPTKKRGEMVRCQWSLTVDCHSEDRLGLLFLVPIVRQEAVTHHRTP